MFFYTLHIITPLDSVDEAVEMAVVATGSGPVDLIEELLRKSLEFQQLRRVGRIDGQVVCQALKAVTNEC